MQMPEWMFWLIILVVGGTILTVFVMLVVSIVMDYQRYKRQDIEKEVAPPPHRWKK